MQYLSNFVAAFSVDMKVNIKHSVFYPGNIVEGVVQISTTREVLVNAIRVKFVGREYVHIERERQVPYQEDGETHYRTEIDRFDQRSCFFKELVTLAGCFKHGGGPPCAPWVIPAGTYYYPFAFQLPANLPASLYVKASGSKDSYAGIFYQVKTYVDIPNGRDSSAIAPFAIVRPLRMDQYVVPHPISVDRNFDITCCLCCSKGKNSARFFMDRTVVALDRDTLTVCVDVDNTLCKEPVEAIVVSLDHQLEARAQGQCVQQTTSVGNKRIAQKVEVGQKGRVTGTFELPRSSSPSACTSLVKSSYKISIELDIPWASDPSHTFNVVVAQTVDSSNTCPPLLWGDSNTVILHKGQLSMPERYYAPPPAPVYTYAPIPMAYMPQGAPLQMYSNAPAPLGMPDPQWTTQGAPYAAPGKQASPQMGFQWQQGHYA